MSMSLAVWSTGITTIVIGIATVTDLRSRRIPNLVTFPAILLSLIVHAVGGGWGGFLFSASGAILAPAMLHLLHAGKGPGAGDLKLASVLGANLGPLLGTLAVLISAVAGGILAVLWTMIEGLRRGRPSARPDSGEVANLDLDADAPGGASIPYALALTAGALVTLFMYWTGRGAQWPM